MELTELSLTAANSGNTELYRDNYKETINVTRIGQGWVIPDAVGQTVAILEE